MKKIVIIGTGIAGYTVAREFRRRDEETELLLISRDDGSSYSKPMLSNALTKNKTADELVMGNPEKMAEDLKAEIWNKTQVINIDAQKHSLEIERNGQVETVRYDRLVLANGANTINAPIEGDAAVRVLSVNDLEDYREFREQLEKGKRIVIIGAGMIGCEFANDLSAVDAQVSIVNLSSHALSLMIPEEASELLQEKLLALGVDWYFNNSVTHVEKDSDALKVTLKDGTQISCDLVLSAIGLRPSLSLAESAGLATERGIKVNRFLQTSDKDIYALGDCAQVEDLTLPFIMPLMTSARALAATLAGEETAVRYPAMPVALKTPCYPTVVCPAPRKMEGEWEVEINDQGLCALFKDDKGTILGFTLMGERTSEKAALAKQIPDWLA